MSRPELLVLSGLHTAGVAAVIARIRALDPDVAVLHHDLRDAGHGVAYRRLRHGAQDVTTALELAHGCMSCTLRDDLLPTLRALAAPGGPRRIVLHLDPALEPEQICWSLVHVLLDGTPVTDDIDLRGVVTAIDPARWFADATSDEALIERGLATLPDDDRSVAQVAVGQAEFADLLVHTGTADAWALARTDATLARLAPTADRVRLAELDERVFLRSPHPSALRGRPADVHGPLLRGRPPLDPDCGLRMQVFGARRPFHPARFHDAIDVLLDGVVRTRGRIWLATHPDDVLWLESAGGGLQVGHAGRWLASAGGAGWASASADRRAMAALGWDDRFGDRAQDLVILCHDADPDSIETVLRAALLTDSELVGGAAAWAAMPDPFGFSADPPEPVTVTATEHKEY